MRSYRSLRAWQKARAVALATLDITSVRRGSETWALFDQLRRAAISVEANIVEGYALGTPGLFRRHLRIALGSAAEVECLLDLSVAARQLDRAKIGQLARDVDELVACLTGLLRSPRSMGSMK